VLTADRKTGIPLYYKKTKNTIFHKKIISKLFFNRAVNKKSFFFKLSTIFFTLILTCPIISQGADINAFRIDPVREVLFLSGGLSLNLIGKNMTSKVNSPDIQKLSKNDIPAFDRFAADYYSKKLSRYSNYTAKAATGTTLLLAFPFKDGINRDKISMVATDFIILLEAGSISMGLTQCSKGLFKRERPYAYNDEVSLNKRESRETSLSFWSSHTAHTFTMAVATGYIFQNRYPESALKKPVWAFGLTCATATGILRVKSGNHFPSDVIAGAAVGSLTGWLIPRIHKNGNNGISISPSVNGTEGILISFIY
jgi:hypothetical protein